MIQLLSRKKIQARQKFQQAINDDHLHRMKSIVKEKCMILCIIFVILMVSKSIQAQSFFKIGHYIGYITFQIVIFMNIKHLSLNQINGCILIQTLLIIIFPVNLEYDNNQLYQIIVCRFLTIIIQVYNVQQIDLFVQFIAIIMFLIGFFVELGYYYQIDQHITETITLVLVIILILIQRIRYYNDIDRNVISELLILDLFTKLNGDTIIYLSSDGGYWLGETNQDDDSLNEQQKINHFLNSFQSGILNQFKFYIFIAINFSKYIQLNLFNIVKINLKFQQDEIPFCMQDIKSLIQYLLKEEFKYNEDILKVVATKKQNKIDYRFNFILQNDLGKNRLLIIVQNLSKSYSDFYINMIQKGI